MRIIFMGTPKFAADILEELANHFEIVCVYTRPDKVRGRGNVPCVSPVKERALALGLPVRTPSKLSDEEEIGYAASLESDAICVAAYGMILPPAILRVPRYGCLNVHASLLPRWRGAAPVERAILAGDEYVGVCIMRMEEGLDTGEYCITRRIPVEGKSAEELTDDLASLGAISLISALNQLEAGQVHWISQDETLVTYADKIAKQELYLDPSMTSLENQRRVQASSPAHPARAIIAGREVIVEQAKRADGTALDPGTLSFEGKRLLLACADGSLEVMTLKPAGKRSMESKAFLAGLKGKAEDDLRWSSI